ncbi:hypothetical protein M422DRAFT_247182 [Sphaerobolus stellatus SS14]|nr:hypothetical protein M422DRAFT_247182 [Sphaerobolus stellatus SS14]
MVHIVSTGKRYKILLKMHELYGGFVPTLSINVYDAVGPIYAAISAWNKSKNYALEYFSDNKLFFMQERETHNIRRKKYWAPAFTPKALKAYEPFIIRRTAELIEVMKHSTRKETASVDMSDLLMRWTHGITCDMTVGDANDMNLTLDGDPTGLVAQ